MTGDPFPASVVVRCTTEADLRQVLRVCTAAWRAAYQGILPPAYLDAVDDGPDSLAQAVRRFRSRPASQHHLVAEWDGTVAGFATCGPERIVPTHSAQGGRSGEVYALYVHPDVWNRGIGTRLFEASRELLARDGFDTITLWVLQDNIHARRFYTSRRLHPNGAYSRLQLGGVLLPELQYEGTAGHPPLRRAHPRPGAAGVIPPVAS